MKFITQPMMMQVIELVCELVAESLESSEALGDPVKAQEFERVLDELGGDFEITLEDGTKRSARALLEEARADAKAAAELEACIGEVVPRSE